MCTAIFAVGPFLLCQTAITLGSRRRRLSKCPRRPIDRNRSASMAAAVAAVLVVSPGDSSASSSIFLPQAGNGSSRLAVSRPSWIVRTESNVRREKMKKPEPHCVVCEGSGRIDCQFCVGRGRSNRRDLVMLPKGEWPKWCKVCGGSGLGYCNRCLGTGEYRDIMGFHFMKNNRNQT